MMNLITKLVLVTCVFAVTLYVASSDQGSEPPKILSVTLSPPGPLPERTEVSATARIYSPQEEPVLRWTIIGGSPWTKLLEYELTNISESEYESTVSFGSIRSWSKVFLEVNNSYGNEVKHIEFDFVAEFAQPCKTSEQCFLVNNKTECDPEEKRCFCKPGYGIDYEEDKYYRYRKTCKSYPFLKVKYAKIDQPTNLDCKIYSTRVKEINWFRGGIPCEYGSQDPRIRFDEYYFYFQRKLWLENGVSTNNTYTCQVVMNDGRNWTVSETELVVVSEPPKILSVTLSPSALWSGTEVNATARIYSPVKAPFPRWRKFGINPGKVLEDELIKISESEYESTVSLGPIYERSTDVFLDVSNNYGRETKHIEFDFSSKVGEYCKTSEQCLLESNNSECDPVKKRCFCQPGYGVDYDKEDRTCEEYPFRTVKNLKLEKGIDMDCRISIPDVSKINWYRNGILCAYGSKCAQDEKIRYDEQAFTYQRRLWLKNGIMESANYTCQVTTLDGKNLTVTENELVLEVPRFEQTKYLTSGSNYTVLCERISSSSETRLIRDGKDICTPDATWCSKRNEWYDVLNLRDNHTFTCDAIRDEGKPVTVSVYYFIIGEIPKIIEVTISPPGIPPRGTEVVATARIHSPSGEPYHQWKLSYDGREKSDLKENFTLLSENDYESTVSLGLIQSHNAISFEVSNTFGDDKKEIKLRVGVGYDDRCDDMTVCVTNNTECSSHYYWSGVCRCRQGYVWDSSSEICRQNAALGQPCEISEQCGSARDMQCDPEMKRCFCKTGYGIDYETDDKKCKYYPFQNKVQFVEFEKGANVPCQVFISNLSEINWFQGATRCNLDEPTKYDENDFSYSRNLTLLSVIRNGTYTCRPTNSYGRMWDVAETQVVVVPINERTSYLTFGEDHNIICSVATPYLEVRLVLDGKESCTPGASWCSLIEDTWSSTQKSVRLFNVRNQRTNSTYTCEAYNGDEKLATVEVFHILIDPKPKILEVIHSPVQKGTDVVATARFFSPQREPKCDWTLNDRFQGRDLKLSILAENIYESKVSLGLIEHSGEISFSISNNHGEDTKNIKVGSGGTVHKGGILPFAVAILLTLFRSTTSTDF